MIIEPSQTMSAAASLMVERKIQKRKPVIIYLVPPEVIHVDASEFMALVQRLTGKSSSSSSSASSSKAPRQVKLHESPCKDSDSNRSSRHRQFPVRVKARLALSRPGSETQYSTPSSCLSEFAGSYQDVQSVAPQSKWLIHGGQSHGLAPEYAIGSYNFIDIFQ